MGRICLVRHGETDWNKLRKIQGRTDILLNDNGKRQAHKAGKYLSGYIWDRVISSPLQRARETAEIIADIIGVNNIEIDDNLIERYYGLAEGMTNEERMKKYPNRNYENMEKWETLQNRIFITVKKYANENQSQNIIMVSHGGAINSLLYTLSDGEYGSGITKLHMGSLSMLVFKDGHLMVEYFNFSPDRES